MRTAEPRARELDRGGSVVSRDSPFAHGAFAYECDPRVPLSSGDPYVEPDLDGAVERPSA